MDGNNKNLLGAKRAGMTYSVMICFYAVLSFVGGMFIGFAGIKTGTVAYYAVSVLFSLISMLLVYFFACKWSNEDIIAVSGVRKFSPVYIIVAVTISAGMFLGFGALNEEFASLIAKLGANLPTGGVGDVVNSTGTFILFSVLVGLLPAIVEEVFFRGLLVYGLKNAGRFITVVFVAVCFAIYHASVVQFIYQLIYGGMLTLLTIKAKSIVPSIIAHFLNNFLILVLTYFFNMQNAVRNPVLIAVGVLLVVISALFLVFYKKKKPAQKVKGEAVSFLVSALPGIIVSLIIAIVGVIPL